MKFKLVIDCDDVLNNLSERAIQMYNDKYHANLTQETFNSFDIYKCLTFEEANNFCALWQDKMLWDSLSPVRHSQWAIKHLIDNGYDVFIATATHPENFAWKVDWLNHYFPFVDAKNIIRIADKSILNADVMVDDCADNLTSNIYCHRICFDRPWNRALHDDVYGVHRCNNWDDIVNTINTIYKEEANS